VGFDGELGRPIDRACAIEHVAAYGLSMLVASGGIGQVPV
jgi:hypothetical protein